MVGETDNNDENKDDDDPMLFGQIDSDDSDDQTNERSIPPAVQSTKLPIKPRPKSLKKKLQEEEFNVMRVLPPQLPKREKKKNVKVENVNHMENS